MKKNILIIILFFVSEMLYAQHQIVGKVLSSKDSLPIHGAAVSWQENKKSIAVSTTNDGVFTISLNGNRVALNVSHVGYQSKTVSLRIPQTTELVISLVEDTRMLDMVEIVSTGYQKIPKERATGSFSTVSKELFNQQVGTDILSRLPAIANSVVLDNGRGLAPQMMVRGLSTIHGPKDPLIVIDNFPYDGDINNINPNIVEHITILKDASASSIWGARAANGVIVITTKSGRFNQPITFEFNSNLSIGNKPDLGYIRQMSSADFIDVEEELFSRDFYTSQINSNSRPVLSPVVDLLNRVRTGELTQMQAQSQIDALRTLDVRDQFNEYMYKPSVMQQYFLSVQGGAERFSWTSSVGYDHNKESLGESFQRINLRFQNTYRPIDNLSVTTGLYFTQSQNKSSRNGYNDVGMKGDVFPPYMQFVDEEGSALAVPRTWNQSYIQNAGDGQLLDWNYYPMTDWKHQRMTGETSDILGNVVVNYRIFKGLNAAVNYQYERQMGLTNNLGDEDSYMARNYVNTFAQIVNGSAVFIVPQGGILDKTNNILDANNIRGQINFDQTFDKHDISAIAGTEIRSANNKGNRERYYGYNENNLTTGVVDYTKAYPNFITGNTGSIQNNQELRETATRFVSYFANAAYTYNHLYVFSASVRRDASNLFGLTTNDQWNPFWSAGFAWKLSKEKFYSSEFLPHLNFRATYGFSGNVDPSMVAVSTIGFLPNNSVFTNSPVAQYNNYYNPELKWETAKMLNLAVDFRTKNERIAGTVEYYKKRGENLFGVAPVDYTTGVPKSMLRNVASMKGDGWDIELKSLNIARTFRWQTILNFSMYKDRITDYLIDRNLASQYVSTWTVPISGMEGMPVYAIYAYKWAGLDPNTGEAQGYLDGEISKNYASIIGTGTKVEDLEYFGSAIPTKFGSLINAISYKNINLQMGLSFKFGYWMKRSSINYTNLFSNWQSHSDYALRWQKTGDELVTNVPVNPYKTNTQRDAFYAGSSGLIEKADHIRLQYINLGYDLPMPKSANNSIKALQLYFNVRNIGLLWKANKSEIDPDFNMGAGYQIVAPISYTLGIRTKF